MLQAKASTALVLQAELELRLHADCTRSKFYCCGGASFFFPFLCFFACFFVCLLRCFLLCFFVIPWVVLPCDEVSWAKTGIDRETATAKIDSNVKSFFMLVSFSFK